MTPVATLLLAGFLVSSVAWADDSSVSPYIDSLKQKMQDKGDADSDRGDVPDPYLQAQKRKLEEKGVDNSDGTSEPYINELKRKHPERYAQPDGSTKQPYIDNQKNKMAPAEDGGAIQAYREGRSQLKMKREGQITGAIGFRIGTAVSRTVSAQPDTQQAAFSDLYGTGFAPDFTLFGEYQPFHSEILGSLGLVAQFGVSIYNGTGKFQAALLEPDGVTPFPAQSNTHFRFLAIPVSAGADYRFTVSKWVCPYVLVAPTVIGFTENRDDGISGHHGFSKAFTTSLGVNILMDFLSNNAAWDLYSDDGIKHTYLSVEYTKLTTIASNVNFNFSGLDLGITFEF